jgi:NAD+ synthase (glutamine-hydrolysing)
LLDSSGSEIQRAPFEEGCFWERHQDLAAITAGDLATLWQVLVTGLRDYCRKTGQTKLLLGLSGGIDSALAAAIAVEAIGAANVIGVALPSRFSSEHSIDDAKQLAANLKMEIRQIPIEPVHKAFESAMRFSDLAGENLQARIRAVLLMGISNSENALLLSTGNKSEIAVGYSTMYGDSAGGFAPIKDLFKTDVWKVSSWLNERDDKELIPSNSITKEPSAELRAEQVDTDSLPDYQVLDEVLALLIEQSATIEQVVAQGHEAELVERIEALVRASEWKRSQGAIGTKTTPVAFGTGRRVPLTTRFTKL